MKSSTLLTVTAVMLMSAAAANAGTIDPAQAIAQKFSEANDAEPKAVVPKPIVPKRSFASPGAEYEADMLARARAEEYERQQKQLQQIIARSKEPEPAELSPAPSSPAPPSPAPPAPVTVASPVPMPEIPTAIEPPTEPTPPFAKVAAIPEKPTLELEPQPLARTEIAPPKITAAAVLLVLDPDGSGFDFKPDPIVCIDSNCWLSNGMNAPALRMRRSQATMLDGTENMTASSCSGKSGCVYRNVTIDPTARIEVIEIGEGGGASAGAYTVAADQSCRSQGASLVCDNGLATEKFRIWIVPEATAASAGATRLENAVAEGLPDADVTTANDR